MAITTRTADWLRITLGALPLWWVLGLDQFIWVGITLILVAWHLRKPQPMQKVPHSWLLFGFLSMVLLSSIQVEEAFRYLTFIKQTATYASGLGILWLVYQTHGSPLEIEKTLRTIAWVALVSTVCAALGISGIEVEFTAPTAVLLPSSLPQGLISAMMEKSWVAQEAGWFLEGWPRPRGLMLYGNPYAAMTLIGVGLAVTCAYTTRGRVTVPVLLFAVIALVTMVFTLSRGAWLAAVIASLVTALVGKLKISNQVRIAALLLVALCIAHLVGITEIVLDRFTSKAHSNSTRMRLYSTTFSAITDDLPGFLIGAGTQKTSQSLGVPLGSHSTYMAILYRHGFPALAAYLTFLILIVLRMVRAIRATASLARLTLLRGVLFAVIALGVQGLVTELDVLDATFAHVTWILFGLGLALSDPKRVAFFQAQIEPVPRSPGPPSTETVNA